MDFPITILLLSFFTVVYVVYRRSSRISIAHIPGPKPESFLLGNLAELYQGEAGEAEFKWQEAYGDIVRFKAPFGEDRLLISDPKALQYIYHTSGYNFHKQQERREISRIMVGRGITWADGEDHKRHRKVMLPGFGGPEARAYLPIFSGYAALLTAKWNDVVSGTVDQSMVFNVPSWISRAMLDAIGEAAFDYHFGVMENDENPLGKAYIGFIIKLFGTPSKRSIFMQSIWQYLPVRLLQTVSDYAPSPMLDYARNTAKIADSVAKSLVDSKSAALLDGKGKRDIMSLLVKANGSENAKTQMSEEEMLAQMRTIMLAGHETTANTLSFTLLELSQHPEIQHKLRTEIRAVKKDLYTRGHSEFSPKDFEGMPYTLAVIKEALRFHPISFINFRQAGRNDVLPLSKPITTTSGEVINELPIPKGLKIITSIAGYNRNKDIFGDDAHTFNPDRWLNGSGEKNGPSVGVYSNLLTFAGGLRSCIGWRFAVLELQAFLIELVDNFEFSLPPNPQRIRREACLVMIPTVEGQREKGAQLPLRISVASREEQ